MRTIIGICGILTLLGAGLVQPVDVPEQPVLHVEPDGWGNAPAANVEAVLRSAAEAILVHVPDHGIESIHVGGGGGPIVLYERAEDGGYRVRLSTRDTYWCQYAFQFAHEVCHILCGYDTVHSGNQFLEETICEVASLFALRQMAKAWHERPPYSNWSSYAPHLASYAQDRLESGRLPEGTTLSDWYCEHGEEVRALGSNREKNLVIAGALLPLFEQHPENAWQAVRYLNTNEPGEPQTLEEHLQRWHDATPVLHQPFVRALASEFDLTLRQR